MSDSLKRDVINATERDLPRFIKRVLKDNDGSYAVYSDSSVERVLEEDTNIFYKDKLQLFNVQISYATDTKCSLINKFVYAINEDDAKRLVFKRYENINIEVINVYCQRVDIQRGMMFNA